jgi:hypothetical protein
MRELTDPLIEDLLLILLRDIVQRSEEESWGWQTRDHDSQSFTASLVPFLVPFQNSRVTLASDFCYKLLILRDSG